MLTQVFTDDQQPIVHQILHDLFPATDWHIERPVAGRRKPSFVARSAHRAVFVKLDVEASPVQRLGELGVAPPVIAVGLSHDRPWLVQPWLEGITPDRHWLRHHRLQVLGLFAAVHADRILTGLLHESTGIATDLAMLQQRLGDTDRDWFEQPDVVQALGTFLQQGAAMPGLPLVPTHDEPNTSNMLVVNDRLYLLDWDDLRIADPIRDLGPLLWWYYPPLEWDAMLASAALPRDTAMHHRIHWFAARASLDIALWHAEQGSGNDHGFLGDFVAAAAGHPNPRT